MILTQDQIMEEISRNKIVIDPLDKSLFRQSSYILRLSNKLIEFNKIECVDVLDEKSIYSNVTSIKTFDSYIIRPHQLILSSTYEKIGISEDYAGIIMGLSHIARLGLSLLTSSFISPGFGIDTKSTLTLELFSVNPSSIKIYKNMPICHIIFLKLAESAKELYDQSVSFYSGKDTPYISQYPLEFNQIIKKIERNDQ